MSDNLSQKLTGIIVGIRFETYYPMQDLFGAVVDNIYYHKKTIFSPDIFPLVNSSINNRFMFNQTTGDSLNITLNDIVLSIKSEKLMQPSLEKFYEFFETAIFKNNTLSVIRVGIVHEYEIKTNDIEEKIKKGLFGNTFKGLHDFDLSLSHRNYTEKSYINLTINDYTNVIYKLNFQPSNDFVSLQVDNQVYFVPAKTNFSNSEFLKFTSEIRNFNNKELPKIIAKMFSMEI